jgi:hypothetical protein
MEQTTTTEVQAMTWQQQVGTTGAGRDGAYGS